MYVKCNSEASSGNHCCSEKVISITYAEFVFVALVTHHAIRMYHIAIYGLPYSTIFSRILVHAITFGKKKLMDPKFVFWFYVQFCLHHFSF